MGRREKGNAQPFPFTMKRTWPHLHYIFFSFCLPFLSPLLMSHYLYTNTHPICIILLFFSYLIYIYLSSLLSQLLNTHNTTVLLAEHKRRREKTKKARERKRNQGDVCSAEKVQLLLLLLIGLFLCFALLSSIA